MVSQMADFTSSRAFRVAGAKAFEEAAITHSDVDHLMIYDAFAHLPIYGLEDLGFVGRGEGGPFIAERNTAPGGKLPLNTNGGGLSYMHSGMYGMYALQESVRQMRGIAPAQVAGAISRSATGSAACSPPAAQSFSRTSHPRHEGPRLKLSIQRPARQAPAGSRFCATTTATSANSVRTSLATPTDKR